MRHLDLQRIRVEANITQKQLSELTCYPQSFISKMERGLVAVPEPFIEKVEKVLGIEDIEPYVTFGPKGKIEKPEEPDYPRPVLTDKETIKRLLDMIAQRDKTIEWMQDEITRLRSEQGS